MFYELTAVHHEAFWFEVLLLLASKFDKISHRDLNSFPESLRPMFFFHRPHDQMTRLRRSCFVNFIEDQLMHIYAN